MFYKSPATYKFMRKNNIILSGVSILHSWLKALQNVMEVKKQQTLKPSMRWSWTYKSIEHLMTAGIYNYETMKNT